MDHQDNENAVAVDEPTSELTDDGVMSFEFPQKTKPKVAIVGFATGHHFQAPFADDDVEIWGINRLHQTLPDRRWTRWFELHDLNHFYRDDEAHKQFLRDFDGPVYVRGQDYLLAKSWGIDNAYPFPDQILTEAFPPYYTNTVSWLIALAILMEFEWLGLYGVDMAVDNLMQAEYGEQRPSCEMFLGWAMASGIEVFIPHGSDLLKATHLYGFEDSGPVLMKMMSRFQELGRAKEQVRAQRDTLEAQMRALDGQLSQLDGGMQEIGYWKKNWLSPQLQNFNIEVTE